MKTIEKTRQCHAVTEWLNVAPVAFDPIACDGKGGKKTRRLGRLTYEFETADCVNGNRRVYPSDVVTPAMELLNEEAARGRIFGRNDHPDVWSAEAGTVTIGNAAVRVISCEMITPTRVRVIMDILDNEHGEQLMSTIENGGNPAISQRCRAYFESATDAEKVKWGVGLDTYLEICRVLRLLTYDVVCQPGFDDADDPSITEAKEEPLMKTVAELKANAGAVYQEVLAEGIAQGKASIDLEKVKVEAVAAAKPAIVKEAIDPLKTELEGERAKIKKLEAFAESCKKLLLDAGIAVEQVSDAEMQKRLGDTKTELAETKAKLKIAEESLAATSKQVAEQAKIQGRAAAKAAVEEKYAGHTHLKLLTESIKDIDDAKVALEMAAVKVAEWAAVTAGMKPAKEGKDDGAGKPPAEDGKAPAAGEKKDEVSTEAKKSVDFMSMVFDSKLQ